MLNLYSILFQSCNDECFVVAESIKDICKFVEKESKNFGNDFLLDKTISHVSLLATKDFSPTGNFQGSSSPLLFINSKKEK